MKLNIIRAILIILLLFTFIIIFGFSSQDGEESGGLSKKITLNLLEISNKYNNLPEKQKIDIEKHTEKFIRKIAHFSIYTVVGLLLMGLLFTYKIKNKNRIIITTIIGIIYATSDEFHQSFSPGRTPLFTDVCIDTLGVLLGTFLINIFKLILLKKSQKKKNKIS